MATRENCPECDIANLYVHGDVSAKGGYGPGLLPGISSIFVSAKMKAIVCKDCGVIRSYAPQYALAQVNADRGWQRLLNRRTLRPNSSFKPKTLRVSA